MKKIKRVTKTTIYQLNKEDKNAIKRIYDLLKVINSDMDENDMLEINEDDSYWFQYEEIKKFYDGLERLLSAYTLSMMIECKEKEEISE